MAPKIVFTSSWCAIRERAGVPPGLLYSILRVAAHRLLNFLLMVAMHDYYYCILTGTSPLQHKDKIPAEGAAH